jgi:hypothetical protein
MAGGNPASMIPKAEAVTGTTQQMRQKAGNQNRYTDRERVKPEFFFCIKEDVLVREKPEEKAGL